MGTQFDFRDIIHGLKYEAKGPLPYLDEGFVQVLDASYIQIDDIIKPSRISIQGSGRNARIIP